MPRPMWNGSISFGLVNIPVKLYNAVKKKGLQFHQLRQSDGCRIRLKRVCSTDETEVPNEQIVKGYEISPDRYVVVSSEELESLSPQATKSIDIEEFVLLEQIDPLYFQQSYYLVPDKGAGKAYSLLLRAMEDSRKVAIAKVILRNKQYLTAIRPAGSALTLSTMFYADEIIRSEQLEGLPETGVIVDNRELTIALQLIESLTTAFQPEKYHDEYREKVLAMIENKAEGQSVVAQKPAEMAKGKVVDLMAALEASLSAMNKKKKPIPKPRRKKARAE